MNNYCYTNTGLTTVTIIIVTHTLLHCTNHSDNNYCHTYTVLTTVTIIIVTHTLLQGTNHATLPGTRVERDFVEAPSQMLEYWTWEKDSLRLMSGHYKDDSPIPEELLSKLVSSKLANVATSTCRLVEACI